MLSMIVVIRGVVTPIPCEYIRIQLCVILKFRPFSLIFGTTTTTTTTGLLPSSSPSSSSASRGLQFYSPCKENKRNLVHYKTKDCVTTAVSNIYQRKKGFHWQCWACGACGAAPDILLHKTQNPKVLARRVVLRCSMRIRRPAPPFLPLQIQPALLFCYSFSMTSRESRPPTNVQIYVQKSLGCGHAIEESIWHYLQL